MLEVWYPWAMIASFLLVYALAWKLGKWTGERTNRKRGGPLR